jgi:hypothetical protein
MTTQTILPPEVHGVMFVTGYRGLGKSFLAAQADLPQNIHFFDFENKGEGIDAQLDFKSYTPLTQHAQEPLQLWRATDEAINKLEGGTVLVIDNVSPLELAMNAEASYNAEDYAVRYGLNLKNIKAGRFGGTKSIVNFMISDLCARVHAKGIRLIIVTSHIKPRWSTSGQIPNKYQAKGADRWQDLSILSLILIPGNPPVPNALVQKEQLGVITVPKNPSAKQIEAMMRGEAGHEVRRRLPYKLSPCTFQKIRQYLSNPVDFDKLKPEEQPTFEESDPFAEKLTKEQFDYITHSAAIVAREEREDKEIDDQLALEEQLRQKQNMDAMVRTLKGFDIEKGPLAVQQHLAERGFAECDIPTAVTVIQKIKEQ